MKNMKKYTLILVLLLLFALPGSAFAQGNGGDQVVFGGNYRLLSGEVLEGNLVVFGGSVDLEEESLVDGDVLLFGGNISVDGEIDGDLIVIGGFVQLLDNAVVRGDLITPGGSVNREEGSRVEGQVIMDVEIPLDVTIPRLFVQPIRPQVQAVDVALSIFWGFVQAMFLTLTLAAFAVLLVMFLPEHTRRTSEAIAQQPVLAGGLGLLTSLVLPPLLLILALITLLLLSPISILGLIVFVIAIIFGWIAVGLEVGKRFVLLINQEWPVAVAAGVGTFFLTILALAFNQIPCIGWLPWALVACVGLGGVLLTRFGTQSYEPLKVGPQVPGQISPEIVSDAIEVEVQDVADSQIELDETTDDEIVDDVEEDSDT
jgi:hypothetical protein